MKRQVQQGSGNEAKSAGPQHDREWIEIHADLRFGRLIAQRVVKARPAVS
jgi:hypothetical protein